MESKILDPESLEELKAMTQQEERDDPFGEENNVRRLVEPSQTFSPEAPGGELHDFFEGHPSAESVVVLDKSCAPKGLVMRNDYYQKLGSPYGRDLFLKRAVKLVMNPHPLIVDVSVDIATISRMAMNRSQRELYDSVIVTEDERFLGVVSIKRFMIELSKNKEKEIELLKKQKDILRMANEAEVLHRRQIEEKNSELRERNDAIKNLLDNAGQGFLTFGSDLLISEEHSLQCVHIFRSPIGGKNFLELMEKHASAEFLEIMDEVFRNVFTAGKNLQQKVYLSLLPGEFCIYNKSVAVEYKVILHGGCKRMMLVLTDITDKKELENKMEQERRNLTLVVRALSQQAEVNEAFEDFAQFVRQDAPRLVWDAASTATALAELFRAMHTFKGDFAQLGLHNTADRLHELEDGLAELCDTADTCSMEQLEELVACWDPAEIMAEDKAVIVKALGKSFFETEERFLISKAKLMELERRVAKVLPKAEREAVLPLISNLRRRNVKELLKIHEDNINTLALRLGKALGPLAVSGDDVLVNKDDYQKFFKTLTHVFRNMVDHGIEAPDERLENGKHEQGRITCSVARQGEERFSITIADDGVGIDADAIRGLALARGIVDSSQAASMTDAETYDILFHDAFSTREEVTSLSGRGVGLAAVREAVEELGGDISVWSAPGEGASFRFTLPLLGT